ncbi:hypothetical protein [Massilia sp. Leaf139]|uniref:DUF6950 family protein n=1 Tax=Massilia sp. Leaf139 TaxID=1736272 RepID=UPI00070048B0|nr:hypothetical protein [Massilia sp. Leaf139]KQQ90392.1 hypothetical protein ASF77_23345 [Massilia sp. Leaf139]
MKLHDYITGHLGRPFEWGKHDCVLFAVGWLEQTTGRDFLGPYKPWGSAIEAARKVAKAGGLDLLFDQQLAPINPHRAVDGDLAIIRGTAYLFSGAHVVSVGEEGLVFKDRLEAAYAWSHQIQKEEA